MSWMNRKSYINISQIFVDAICLIITYIFAVFLTGKIFHPISLTGYLWIPILFVMVYIFSMFTCEMYHRSTFTYQDRTLKYVLKSCIYAAVFCLVMIPFATEDNVAFNLLMIYILSSIVVISMQYIIVQELRLSNNSRWKKRAVLVGCKENIQEYLYYIKKTSFQVDVIGYVILDPYTSSSERNLGSIENLSSILKDNVIDEVIFSVPCHRVEEIKDHVMYCKERGMTVKLAMDFFELGDHKTSVHTVGTIPVFTWQTANFNDLQIMIKRLIDIAGAIFGLLLMVLISILVIPLILIQMKGSIFVRREYLSVSCRPFTLYCFRTISDDSSLRRPKTFIGKVLRFTGIDHFPMFWNVLRGEMSLVGSLPVSATSQEIDACKLRSINIKPGLTGVWRFGDKERLKDTEYLAELDAQYMNKWSWMRDMWLLFRTIMVHITLRSSRAGTTLYERLNPNSIYPDLETIER